MVLFYSPQPVIDLQLPEQEFVAIKVPSVKEKEHTFKEKVVGSVGPITKKESTETISFKKSKFKKSNCRKRLDDDWWNPARLMYCEIYIILVKILLILYTAMYCTYTYMHLKFYDFGRVLIYMYNIVVIKNSTIKVQWFNIIYYIISVYYIIILLLRGEVTPMIFISKIIFTQNKWKGLKMYLRVYFIFWKI